MKKVITYGTFDLLHHGHVNLLRRAKELGDYLIVGVTSSDFDKNRGKINVKQSLMDRIEAVKALGIADEVIPEEYYGQKIDDIRNYDVDIFAIGSDWRGHFDYLNEYCEVVYLDRTEGISSTQLREGGHHIALGIVGASRDIAKFIDECKYVSGVDVVGAFPDSDEFDLAGKTALFGSLEKLIEASDALYVANAPERRFATAKAGLEAGKDVLSESPVALAASEAEALFAVADERGLVFHEAVKTAYALAFSRLTLLVKSGMIGSPVSVRATCEPRRQSHRLGTHRLPPHLRDAGHRLHGSQRGVAHEPHRRHRRVHEGGFHLSGRLRVHRGGQRGKVRRRAGHRRHQGLCVRALSLVENRLLRGALRGLLQQ